MSTALLTETKACGLGAPDGLQPADPLAAPAELEVDAVLEAALGEAGVDVVGKEAAENLAGVAGCGEERERGDEQELHAGRNPSSGGRFRRNPSRDDAVSPR